MPATSVLANETLSCTQRLCGLHLFSTPQQLYAVSLDVQLYAVCHYSTCTAVCSVSLQHTFFDFFDLVVFNDVHHDILGVLGRQRNLHRGSESTASAVHICAEAVKIRSQPLSTLSVQARHEIFVCSEKHLNRNISKKVADRTLRFLGQRDDWIARSSRCSTASSTTTQTNNPSQFRCCV
eukprot:Lankesteria_metandrocarpae@DN5421_c1_g2_i1.p1